MDLHAPFDELAAQCKTTIERSAPTYYCQTAFRKQDAGHLGYARLLLPLWGNGRIQMLLGAVAISKATRRNPE